MASDKTFRSYKPDQAKQYGAARPPYAAVLFEHIFAWHAATGGAFGHVVDVGCGPGVATRDLAKAFDHAVGFDPGEEMINVARERGGETKSGEKIRFEVCEAERIAKANGLPVGEVDMITAATAAHWFDMKKFWAQAAQLLRPGGTVAIWVKGSFYIHPDMSYAAKANEIHDVFTTAIKPYGEPGNRLAHNLYDDLVLPWTADPSQTAFPEDKFERFEWDRGKVLSDGKEFFGGTWEFPLEAYEAGLATVSPVTRWREAHPELVGTKSDCVAVMIEQLREELGERKLRGGGTTALLMFKKGN